MAVAATLPEGMFIDGDYVASAALPTTSVHDPATGEQVGTAPQGGEAEIDAAVSSAKAAFGTWSRMPAAARGEIMHKAAVSVLAELDTLAQLLTLEQGKPIREAKLELQRFVHTIEHYAGMSKNLRGGYVPNLDHDAHGLILRRPLGVVGAIVPWNFPTTLLANKLGPALVTGNTLVAKPAETTPLTTLRVAQILNASGLPPGVFNVVTGLGSEAGEALVRHADVAKIAFTGSTPVGRHVMAVAAQTTKRVTLELGGSDPMIVCDDANVDAAVKAASVGRFFNCGQACLAVKRLFVHEAVYDEVVEKMLARTKRLRIGHGSDPKTLLGPVHSDQQRAVIEEQVADSVGGGAKLLHGGKRPEGELFDSGFFYEPTLLLEAAQDSRVATEEVFGPALPIWQVTGIEEAIDRANQSVYGLGSSIFTRDLDAANSAAERLNTGYTWINSPQRPYDELPFGGVGQSGFGREHGIEALDHYTESKSVVVRRADADG